MASKRLYKGSPCKHDCGGHKAGARYVRSGGSKPSPNSVAQTKLKKKGTRSRLSVTKRSK